jgi:hypothetical protein
LFQQWPEDGVLVHEIIIELHTFFAGNTAKYDQHRLATLPCLPETRLEVVVDPEALLSDFFAVLAHFLVAGFLLLRGHRGAAERWQEEHDQQKQSQQSTHGRTLAAVQRDGEGSGRFTVRSGQDLVTTER